MPELEWLETARTDLLAIVDYISDETPNPSHVMARLDPLLSGLILIPQ